MLITTCRNVFIRCSNAPASKKDIWIIHGFSESGLTFKNVFDSSLAEIYNIWIPDLPGFGASPYQKHLNDIHAYVHLLADLIREKSENRKILLIGHSFGSLIASLIYENLERQVAGVVSVEGNLTKADFYFSGWAGQYEEGEEFQKDFKSLLFYKARARPEFEDYFASATVADPKALKALGKSGLEFSENEDAGHIFLDLKCPTLYLWGDVDTPDVTQKFISQRRLNSYCFEGGTHWMMKERPDLFYSILAGFFNET